jgi:hypothetical protein
MHTRTKAGLAKLEGGVEQTQIGLKNGARIPYDLGSADIPDGAEA